MIASFTTREGQQERMGQEVSTRTIALLAIALGVVAAVVSWQFVLRYAAKDQDHDKQILIQQDKQSELEHQMLNLGALLLKTSDDPVRARQMVPPLLGFPRPCDALTSPVYPAIERARANSFLAWYYSKLRDIHGKGG